MLKRRLIPFAVLLGLAACAAGIAAPTVAAEPNSVAVVDPNASGTVQGGQSFTIRWSWSGAPVGFYILLNTYASEDISQGMIDSTFITPQDTRVPPQSPNTDPQNYSWTVPTDASPLGFYTVMVCGEFAGANYVCDESDETFNINPSMLKITSPRSGDVVPFSSPSTISWTAAGMTGSVALRLLKGSTLLPTPIGSAPVSTGSFAWTPSSVISSSQTGTNFRIYAIGKTASGKTKTTISPMFSIIGAAPGSQVWANRYGGTGSDISKAVAIDGQGSSVVVGSFTGTGNFGSGNLTSAGSGDVFIAKYGATGTPVWPAKRFGGTGNENANAVAIDRSTNCDGAGGTNCIVVTGSFTGSASFGGATFTSAGETDIFVAKYSATGTHLWSKQYGNYSFDVGYGVAVDTAGNVVLTGQFNDTVNFGGAPVVSNQGDAFVVKLASNGNHLWSRNFTSASADVGVGVTTAAAGDVVVTGWHMGTFDGVLSRGREDIFVARLAGATGAKLWLRHFGASAADRPGAVAVDSADNVLVTGKFEATVDFGGGPLTAAGADAFVLKLAGGTGGYTWVKDVPGTFTYGSTGLGLATDAANNVVATGVFQGTRNFGGGDLTSAGGYSDAFVAKYGSGGAHLWSKRYGHTGGDGGFGVAVDPANSQVIVTGPFEYQINFGGGVLTSAGLSDMFLARLTP